MITLEEACKRIDKQVGATCRILSCFATDDRYVFMVHRRNTGVHSHDAAIGIGHCINRQDGSYSYIDAGSAFDYILEQGTTRCDPFFYMAEDDVAVAKTIKQNIEWV